MKMGQMKANFNFELNTVNECHPAHIQFQTTFVWGGGGEGGIKIRSRGDCE
jgi:hypothetical protein